MPREFSRPERLAAEIQREVASLLLLEARDERLRDVVVTDVSVSRDLSVAWVHVRFAGDRAPEEMLEALARAQGFLRRELGRRLRVRTVPELRFELDTSVEEGERIDRLLDTIRPRQESE